jgi:hypothetical protein
VIPYVETYQKACTLSRAYLSNFDVPAISRFRYITKSGNLATCFLGFSTEIGEEYCQRSAELGALASIFDLTSDGLHFDEGAIGRFEALVQEILGSELAALCSDILNQKRSGSFELDGLYRGVPTLKIIVRHLRAEEFWPNENEIVKAGVLCQIVDDVVDYRDDMARGGLNFLKHENWPTHLKNLMDWDYEKQFSASKYPFVLFRVFKQAKAIAAKLATRELRDSSTRGSILQNVNSWNGRFSASP